MHYLKSWPVAAALVGLAAVLGLRAVAHSGDEVQDRTQNSRASETTVPTAEYLRPTNCEDIATPAKPTAPAQEIVWGCGEKKCEICDNEWTVQSEHDQWWSTITEPSPSPKQRSVATGSSVAVKNPRQHGAFHPAPVGRLTGQPAPPSAPSQPAAVQGVFVPQQHHVYEKPFQIHSSQGQVNHHGTHEHCNHDHGSHEHCNHDHGSRDQGTTFAHSHPGQEGQKLCQNQGCPIATGPHQKGGPLPPHQAHEGFAFFGEQCQHPSHGLITIQAVPHVPSPFAQAFGNQAALIEHLVKVHEERAEMHGRLRAQEELLPQIMEVKEQNAKLAATVEAMRKVQEVRGNMVDLAMKLTEAKAEGAVTETKHEAEAAIHQTQVEAAQAQVEFQSLVQSSMLKHERVKIEMEQEIARLQQALQAALQKGRTPSKQVVEKEESKPSYPQTADGDAIETPKTETK